MNEKDRNILKKVREQVELVKRLKEKMRREGGDRVRSVTLDGMPHARGSGAGLDIQIMKMDALERMISRETEELKRAEEKARRVIEKMKSEWYAFCTIYYIGGFSVEETAEAIGKSERQCWRIRKEIEEEGK